VLVLDLLDSERSPSLSFVRIDDNVEVDLVIERPGLPTYLIEIKSTDRIHEAHVRSVKKVLPRYKELGARGAFAGSDIEKYRWRKLL
jgi:hypothetical protein